MSAPLSKPIEKVINDKTFKIGKIPAIPGMKLFAECSSIVDASSWREIDTDAMMKLVPYASIIRDGVEYRLDNENAINAWLNPQELWLVCLEVYAYNFGFFITGGTLSLMKPLIEARKAEDKAV